MVDPERGVEAHSDGDVVAHACCDAVLGTVALGDLGDHFPSSDPAWAGVSSIGLLRRCVGLAASAGATPTFCDVTVIASVVKVASHRTEIRSGLADALGLDLHSVSVKATTTDGMGALGRAEGIAATAVVTAIVQP